MLLGFYRSLTESKSPENSRIHLIIQANLNNTVIWMVFINIIIIIIINII